MKRYILKGLFVGIGLSLLFLFFGKYIEGSWFGKFLVITSTPIAFLISKISGWPLHQEASILIYTIAILITLPLLGIIIGILIYFMKRTKR